MLSLFSNVFLEKFDFFRDRAFWPSFFPVGFPFLTMKLILFGTVFLDFLLSMDFILNLSFFPV